MINKLAIIWPDGAQATIDLYSNPVAEIYAQSVRHLQHLPLSFRARENPYWVDAVSTDSICRDLVDVAEKLGIEIDRTRLNDQCYLNELHVLYVAAVARPPWSTDWLEFHDCIHLLEIKNSHRPASYSIWFDYRHLAGPLEKPFDRSWLSHAVTQVSEGDCFVREHELGKDLVTCWRDREPNTIETLSVLSKPWIRLRPLLNIAIRDSDNFSLFRDRDLPAFQKWISPVQQAWCQHWDIADWDVSEIFSVIPIGKIDDLALVRDRFMSYNYPMKVRPCAQPD